MLTLLYSSLHFLVDGICAVAMAGRFAGQPGGYLAILLYNFCAFALQMPFGALLDVWTGKEISQKKAFLFALCGSLLTVLGAFTSPVLLGIGNGLFHVGGGVGTIGEDLEKGSLGRRLGVFVAPGAMGLTLGRLAGQGGRSGWIFLAGALVLMTGLLVGLWICLSAKEERAAGEIDDSPGGKSEGREAVLLAKEKDNGLAVGKNALSFRRDKTAPAAFSAENLLIAGGCFFVVILRSFTGMQVGFSWRSTVAAGLLATAAVVLGKMLGGFLAAGFGRGRTVAATLLLSALCYGFSDRMGIGLLALLFFNMTMPITLQILVDRFPALPGTMFGLLTVGLFLGFLPTYFGAEIPLSGKEIGILGSLISLAVLAFLCMRMKPEKTGGAGDETL